jgi:hypothetical protein
MTTWPRRTWPRGRHYEDSGYLSAALVVSEAARRGIALTGPLLADTSPQARAGTGYARAGFTIDYDARTATCPQCTKVKHRQVSLPRRDLAEAHAANRSAETTIPFQADYAPPGRRRAHHAPGRQPQRPPSRYRGLPRTRLDHAYIAVALNLLRLHAYSTGAPLDRHPTSHLARPVRRKNPQVSDPLVNQTADPAASQV